MTDDNGYAEAWKPNAGESITGVVRNVEAIDPNGQGLYPCMTLETADGESRAVHAFHSVLQRELARRKPKVGDEVSITYKGKVQGVNREYHNYVVSGGQGSDMDWGSFLPPDERGPAPSGPSGAAPPIEPAPVAESAAPAGEKFGSEVPF